MGFVNNIDPVIASVGGVKIYWYGFAYTFGFTGMVAWLARERGVLGWSPAQVVSSSIILVAAILAGGRLFEVAVYESDWYRDRLLEIPMLWKGGMATHGLLLGTVLGTLIVARMTRTPPLKLLDCLSVAGAFIFGVGRIGNFIEGGVIGTPTDLPWGVKLPDVEGFRHPVSLYDGLKNLLLIPVLIVALRRWPAGSGVATGIFLVGYGWLRFLVDQFRDYESTLWGMGPGQWANLAMGAIGAIILIVIALRESNAQPARPAAAGAAAPSPPAVMALVVLILFPLLIPTSWTREYLALKRAAPAADNAPSVPGPNTPSY
jgi:phosphatidylglycerol:prolipoprotein diacylglycerol transferase